MSEAKSGRFLTTALILNISLKPPHNLYNDTLIYPILLGSKRNTCI